MQCAGSRRVGLLNTNGGNDGGYLRLTAARQLHSDKLIRYLICELPGDSVTTTVILWELRITGRQTGIYGQSAETSPRTITRFMPVRARRLRRFTRQLDNEQNYENIQSIKKPDRLLSDRCVFPGTPGNRLQIAGVIYLDEGDIDADRKTVRMIFMINCQRTALEPETKSGGGIMATWTDTNDGVAPLKSRPRNQAGRWWILPSKRDRRWWRRHCRPIPMSRRR